MKSFKKLLLSASLLVLAFAGSSQAQIPGGTTVVRITGSTAYRAAVHQAILTLLGSSNQTAYVGSNIAGANNAIFYGSYAGSPIVIKTDWTGSVGGIKALTQNLALYCNTSTSNDPTDAPGTTNTISAWLDNSVITSGTLACSAGPQSIDPNTFPGYPNGILNYKPGTAAPTPPATATATASNAGTQVASKVSTSVSADWEAITSPPQVADVGFTDAFQNTTLYSSPNLGATGQTVTGYGAIVGIVDFVWVKGAALSTDTDYNAWKDLINVTPNLLRQLYGTGHAPLQLFTPLDTTTASVYAIGRDEDSGTRINAFAENYFGVNSGPKQYYTGNSAPSTYGTQVTSGTLAYYPGQTVEGTSESLAHSGFASGGQLAAEMSSYGTDSITSGSGPGYAGPGYFIAYIGLDDATTFLNTTATTAGNVNYIPGQALSWNGVNFDTNGPTKIEQGNYSFWGYEHMYYRTGSITANGQTVAALSSANSAGQTFADALATDLRTTDQLVASGVPLSAMKVTRSVEGGIITQAASQP